MKRYGALALACATLLASGCSAIKEVAQSAMSDEEARSVATEYVTAFNAAAPAYDIGAVKRIETGSLLEGREAEFKVLEKNDYKFTERRVMKEVMVPMMSNYPKWFAAPVRSKVPGESGEYEDLMIFVQEKEGAPWLAASSATVDPEVEEVLGSAVKPETVPEVADANDGGLVMPPAKLPAAHAHAIRYGAKSPQTDRFSGSQDTTDEYKLLMEAHTFFKKSRWAGKTTVSAAPHPSYALRTQSGGALVFYAVDIKGSYKAVSRAADEVSWSNDWGELYPGLVGKTHLRRKVTRVERNEYVAYVPPEGQGKIRVVAARWTPVGVKGT
ncbi:MAG: hypothetical protein GEV11_22570 [Streptosporangiales bacterium]|nr:hypothetical protein [Streptosporangiales bacterium]